MEQGVIVELLPVGQSGRIVVAVCLDGEGRRQGNGGSTLLVGY